MKTQEPLYTQYLLNKKAKWKKFFGVQVPYRWIVKRLLPGFILEIGCGTGRLLQAKPEQMIGVDHNSTSIEECKNAGFNAFTPNQCKKFIKENNIFFDGIVLAHVVEHMEMVQSVKLIKEYLPYIKKQGRLLLITPQEKGHVSDSTHKDFVNFAALQEIQTRAGFQEIKHFSFPFPRFMGKHFTYNEFISLGIMEKC